MSIGKRKNKKESKKEKNCSAAIVLPNSLSKEEMTEIIAKAMLRAEEIKEEKEKDKQKANCHEWKTGIGIKDYSTKPLYYRIPAIIINLILVFLRLPFTRRRKIKTEQITTELLKMALNIALMFACVIFFILAFRMVCNFLPSSIAGFFEKTIFTFSATPASNTFFYIMIAFSAYFLAGLFRVASIEVDLIKDRNVLFGVFASFSSLCSIIIATISLIIALNSK